eukprot:897978-Lingulodinium_polyedra.AAC.1
MGEDNTLMNILLAVSAAWAALPGGGASCSPRCLRGRGSKASLPNRLLGCRNGPRTHTDICNP